MRYIISLFNCPLSSGTTFLDLAAAAICDHIDFMTANGWEGRLNNLAKAAVNELQLNGLGLAMPIRYPTILSCLFVKHGQETNVILKKLHAKKIEAKHYYEPLCERAKTPMAWDLFDSTLCLPFHLDISETDLKMMIAIIASERKPS